MRQRLAIAVLGVVWATLSSCANPCVDLSKKICRCEEGDSRQQACIDRVTQEADNLPADEQPTQAEENRCAELEKSCTCKKLDAGDFAACGLTRPDA